jgi:hypothetical protein
VNAFCGWPRAESKNCLLSKFEWRRNYHVFQKNSAVPTV